MLEEKLVGKNEVVSELMEELIKVKRSWCHLLKKWISRKLRDEIMNLIFYWKVRAEMPLKKLLLWIGITKSKFNSWKNRQGKGNSHNSKQPKDGWLKEWERQAIIYSHRVTTKPLISK